MYKNNATYTTRSFGAPIIDQEDGYGPFNVYNNLAHSLSSLNADSYMYYALVSLVAPSPQSVRMLESWSANLVGIL